MTPRLAYPRRIGGALALALLIGAHCGQAAAQGKPLLMEGKKTLYERVLTRPGAMLSNAAGTPGSKAVATFSQFYVYARNPAAGASWLQVGPSTDGKALAWLKEQDTVQWRHSIVAAFANPTDRDRLLFFRTREALSAAINAPAAAIEKLEQSVAKGSLPAESQVIAAEPANWVDPRKQFYMLPVLEAPTVINPANFKMRAVRIASVVGEGGASAPAATAPSSEGIANFRSAVLFVVDATSSMQPYIDRTRKAMEEILAQVEQAKVIDRVRFGLSAFQDDPAKTKGVEYLTKVFVDPNDRLNRKEFLEAIGQVSATPHSTRAYAEDSYAALDQAARALDWKKFGGRYVVFITDASAREGSSPLASTRLATEQVRAQLQEQGIATFVMHLKTNEGRKDHAVAEEQYKRLAKWPGRGPLYFPVEAGDPARFEADVRRLAQALVEQVKAPQALLDKPEPVPSAPRDGKGDNAASLEASARAVGRAMVLAYLGREQSTRAASMYEAWTTDRDLRQPVTASLSVRVLLTKNQLSDLQTTLRKLVETGERQQMEGGNLIEQLRSVAVAMGREPSQVAQGQVKNLEQSGLMGEYLDGLPYRSELMALDQEKWTQLGIGGAQAVIDRLKSKIALYQRFHDDVDRWVKLNDAASDGERAYPVPLDELP